jgi:hypothetical protein
LDRTAHHSLRGDTPRPAFCASPPSAPGVRFSVIVSPLCSDIAALLSVSLSRVFCEPHPHGCLSSCATLVSSRLRPWRAEARGSILPAPRWETRGAHQSHCRWPWMTDSGAGHGTTCSS